MNNTGCLYESTTGVVPDAYCPAHTLTFPMVNNNCGIQTMGTMLIYGKNTGTSKGTIRFYGGMGQTRYRCENTTDTGVKTHGPQGTSFTWLTESN
jgi:hypothetical protein